MKNIHKITNIVLIFTLIGVVACQDAYGLRVPIGLEKKKASTVAAEISKKQIKNLLADEEKRLTPKFLSVQEFLRSRWLASNPNAKVLWIVRHGESYSNLLHYVQTHDSFTPLTTLGENQVEGLVKFLEECGIEFNIIYSSDLERAYMSVKPYADLVRKPIITSQALREVIIWPKGGMLVEKAKKEFPGVLERFCLNPELFEIPGQFSGHEQIRKTREFLRDIKASSDKNILIASHGMPILLMLLETAQVDFSKYLSAYGKLGNPESASITIISYNPEDERWSFLIYGDNSFLDEQVRVLGSNVDLSAEEKRFVEIIKERTKEDINLTPCPDYLPVGMFLSDTILPIASEQGVEEAIGRENLKPDIEITRIVNVPMADNVTIFHVMVDGEEYEISSLGIKMIKLDLSSEVVDNPQKCIEIANAVNEVESRLGEVAKREKWDWWTHNLASNQGVEDIYTPEVKNILRKIASGKHRPVYDLMLRFELLHELGWLKGNILNPCIGKDFFCLYFGKTFGIDYWTKENDDKAIQEFEEEVTEKGLPRRYIERTRYPLEIRDKDVDIFDYGRYFSYISKKGGVDALLLKGVTVMVGKDYYSYPKRFPDEREAIKDFIIKINEELLNERGYIILASEGDLWIEEFIKDELGYVDLLNQPEYERVKNVLLKDVGEQILHFSGTYYVFAGRVPIRVFQKPHRKLSDKVKPIAPNNQL